jgi:hypothetical protein
VLAEVGSTPMQEQALEYWLGLVHSEAYEGRAMSRRFMSGGTRLVVIEEITVVPLWIPVTITLVDVLIISKVV